MFSPQPLPAAGRPHSPSPIIGEGEGGWSKSKINCLRVDLIFSTYFILYNLSYITTIQWGAIRPRRKESECQILALVGGLQSDCKQTRSQINTVLDDGWFWLRAKPANNRLTPILLEPLWEWGVLYFMYTSNSRPAYSGINSRGNLEKVIKNPSKPRLKSRGYWIVN